MKFVSWNVNGLRACITKGFLDRFNELDADFFCLQETKLSEGQLKLDTPGYEQYWCYAEKKGYSGTAIFTKHTPQSVTYGIGEADLDNEGRVITLEYPEFYLVTCYTPNAQRGLARLDHRMTWDEAFRAYIKKLDEVKPVVICGDLNVAHNEIDLKNPASNRGNAGFSDEERASFTKTLGLGFTDTFRHLYPDATGRYSWWSYMYHARENNAGWRIDYFLVSDRLAGDIHSADIYSDIMGSDHCPVALDLSITCNGGIWSPASRGKATVIDPKPKQEKAPRASAVNAKALYAIMLVAMVAVFAYFAFFFPWQVTPSADTFSIAAIEVYDKPLARMAETAFGAGDGPVYTAMLTGEEDLSAIDEANAIFRIELTEGSLVPDGCTPTFQATDTTVTTETGGAIYTPQAAVFTTIPYTVTPEDPILNGWLVFAQLDSFCASINIGFSMEGEHNFAVFDHQVALFSFLDESKLDVTDTEVLAASLLHSSSLYDTFLNSTVTGTIDLNYFHSIYEDYPALQELADRSDAVSALMSVYTFTDEAKLLANFLLSTVTYQEKMNPSQEAAYKLNCYENCPFDYAIPDVYVDLGATAKDIVQLIISQQELIDIVDSCSWDAKPYAIEILMSYYSPFIRLTQCGDAVDVIMDDCYVESVGFTENLLGWFQYDMDPYGEYLYLTDQYDSYYTYNFGLIGPEIEWLDTALMSSLDLVNNYTGTNDLLEKLQKCHTMEARWYVLSYYMDRNPYLSVLFGRDDMIETLKPLSNNHRDEIIYGADNNLYDYLIELRLYLDEANAAESMTTLELINYILSDPEMKEDLYNCYTKGRTMVYDPETTDVDYGDLHPAWAYFIRREDAIDALLDCDPPTGTDPASSQTHPYWRLPMDILKDCFSEQMTKTQEARCITGDYTTSPNGVVTFNTDKDVTQMTTEQLVAHIQTYGDVLCDLFSQCRAQSLRQEVFNILMLNSNVLQELSTRYDALEVMESSLETGALESAIGYIIPLWPGYVK